MPYLNLAYPDDAPPPNPNETNGPGTVAADAGIKLTDEELQNTFTTLVTEAIQYTDGELSPERQRLMKYYNGDLPAPDPEEGRSKLVLTPFRDTVKRILPSIVRVFMGGERYVEFRPRRAETVNVAKQQTEYIADIVIAEDNDGFLQYLAWFKDALIKRLGVVKWSHVDNVQTTTFEATGYTQEQVAQLTQEPGLEIRTATRSALGKELLDLVYVRTVDDSKMRFWVLPPEEFLTSRKPRDIESAPFVGHRTEKTTAELLEMGLPMEWLQQYGGTDDTLRQNPEEQQRGQGESKRDKSDAERNLPEPAMHEKHLYIEGWIVLPVKSDDDRVVSGLYRVCALGPEYKVVTAEAVDEKPFAILVPDPEPHSIEGAGVGNWTTDLQDITSFIGRQLNNSLALAIQTRLAYVEGEVDADDINTHEIGRPIKMQKAAMIQEIKHDFVGREAIGVLGFYGDVLEERVGVTKASAGLEPGALQSTTQAAVAATVSMAQLQVEMIARVFGETGIRRLMKGLLKGVIDHPREDRVMRMRGQWIAVDPRSWDATLDVGVTVALGGGLVEQRLQALMETGAEQKEILMSVGLDNPLVTPSTYRETRVRMLELRGFKDASVFWPEVDPNWKPAPPQPPPEAQAALMIGQAELKKAESDFAAKQAKASLEIEQAKVEEQRRALDLEIKREEMHMADELERDKLEADIAIKVEEIKAKYQYDLTIEKINADIQREKIASDSKVRVHKIERDAEGRIAGSTESTQEE